MRIGFIFFLLLFRGSAGADTLDEALNRLDHAGSQFKSMAANFNYVKHTAIVNEDSPANGTIKIKRPKPGDLIGLLDFLAPDQKTVSLTGQTVDIYLPKLKTIQEYDLGKQKMLLEQFILFGFGTSRRDLEASYSVSYGGAETLGGEPTTRIVLHSKKPEVAQHLSMFELWISDKTGEPVQQKFYEPSGDYNVFTYSNMKINPSLSASDLQLHTQGKVKKEIVSK